MAASLPGSEEVDSTELCERLEPSLRKFADLTSELRLMRKSQRKTAREAAYDESALLLQRTLGRRRVALEGLQTCLGVHRREVEFVLGIELEKESVNLIPEARRLCLSDFALPGEQLQDRSLVLE
jgi:hypothetical protein